MAILKMKKLRVTVIRSQKEELLRRLLLLGCVEISEPDELLSDPELAQLVSRETAETDKLRSAQADIARATDVLKRYAPVKSPMFIARTDVSADEFLSEEGLDAALELAGKLDVLDSRIRYTTAEEGRENALVESLLPWEPLDLPLDHEGTRTSSVLLGSVPLAVDFFELERTVSDAVPEASVARVSEDAGQQYLCIIYLRERHAELSETLRDLGFSASAPRGIGTTAREEIEQAKRRINDLTEERARMTEELLTLALERDRLRRCGELLVTMTSRAEAQEKFLATASSVTFTGWVPEESAEALEKALEAYDCLWELVDPAPEEYPSVPVKLKNNALSSPLMMVTEMYSLPAYDGVDPNPLMAPFFILFYGMMMADMGYGLVMMLVGLIVKSKKLRDGTMKQLFDLMFLCGITTFVVGACTASFFGDSLTQIAGIFGKEFSLWKPLFSTIDDAVYVLVASFALGFIHIITGMAINMVHKIRSGHVLDGLCDAIPWWTVFAGIALGALGVTWIVMIAGFVLVFLAGGRSSPKLGGKIAGGLSALYDVTSYFGDILSYARLMALMLAGSVIANVFNKVGAMTGNIIAFVFVFALGHALNFGINLLGCYVHDLRLQCLEFFGKFYQDGGRPFKPLAINSKFENIIN